ncbi:DUF6452 domain-containing protein [Flavobacterium gelidilacus]|uniref:DUF6452 family protein n=1 Tax=Flavobacterium gelidilacus TaxID=206041 RepID=UPI000413D0E9|nr:DUF6452 family protein [Flavobacterium gelidilacus]
MKKYIITSLVLLLAVSFWNCEKDDICAETTPTTPKLVIEFFDKLNGDNNKNLTNLQYFEINSTDTLTSNAVSTLSIPLRTTESSTTFRLILNGNDNDLTNDIIDDITINYERNEIYVSRACGYKTNFILNELDGFTTTNNWIFVSGIANNIIDNEDETHVKIYF